MVIRVSLEDWKLEAVRASTLKEARKRSRRSRQRVFIKVDGLVKVTIQPW